MWNKRIKKTIFTLEVDGYEPEIVAMTRPLLERYAKKIVAELFVVQERKFPEWPVAYEKLQIYELAKEMENDWNIYVDADALLHPDLPDFTVLLNKDTVVHHGSDFAPIRWKFDRFFLRDGRYIGSGNWFTIASDWCIELWKPLDDMTLWEALQNIYPTEEERQSGLIDPKHLIDDYTLSRNIAKYGLKFITIRKLMEQFGWPQGTPWFWHAYTMPPEQKIIEMKKVLKEWGVLS
jgi:hypothetical protein